jgi:murein DD-endopeptidase MepM/ murein hydrolase activator NlpD
MSGCVTLARHSRFRRSLLILIVCALSSAPGKSQTCTVTPKQVKLGETLRVHCGAAYTKARLNDREAELYIQPDGTRFGLLPISVHDKPGTFDLEILALSGLLPQTLHVTIRKTVFPSQNVNLSPEIEALHSTPEELALLKTFKESASNSRFWQDPLVPPVSGCMTSPFGVRRFHNGKPTGEYHGGVDQRTPSGEPIRAVAAGTVTFAQPFQVLGNAVGVDHGQGLESMYLHMSRLAVSPGSLVERGAILGYSGSTGRSTGPHLHWVLYVNGMNVNPAQWITLQPCPHPPKAH